MNVSIDAQCVPLRLRSYHSEPVEKNAETTELAVWRIRVGLNPRLGLMGEQRGSLRTSKPLVAF